MKSLLKNLAMILCGAACVALVGGVASAASLGTVYLKYVNPGASDVANPSYHPAVGSSYNSGNVYAGAYQFQIDAAQPRTGLGLDLPVGQTFGAFCMDITQWANSSYQLYNILPLAEGPLTPLNGGMAMGSAKAALLENLWHDHFDLAWVTPGASYTTAQKLNAEAFAACVWEIVFENSNNALNILNGEFTVSGVNYATTANSWLSGLNPNGERTTLFALTSNSYQDYLVLIPGHEELRTVPEPVTMAGVMMGVGSLAAYLRRRRKA